MGEGGEYTHKGWAVKPVPWQMRAGGWKPRVQLSRFEGERFVLIELRAGPKDTKPTKEGAIRTSLAEARRWIAENGLASQ